MKKLSFKFEQQVAEDKWEPFNGVDTMFLDTPLTDPKKLLPLAQDQVDYTWNSRLRSHEHPRRVTEIVKVEEHAQAPKPNWDNFDPYEDDVDDYDTPF